MNLVLLKLQQAALDFGVEKLANLFGSRYRTLLNKLNPNDQSIQLTFYEFYHTTKATGKYDAFLQMGHDFGFICLPIPEVEPTALDQFNFVDMVLQVGERKGDMCAEIRRAFEDKRITPREAEGIKQTIHQLLTLLATMEKGIDAFSDRPTTAKPIKNPAG